MSRRFVTHLESALDGTRLPADRRYANRVENTKSGVEVRADLRDKILGLTASTELGRQ